MYGMYGLYGVMGTPVAGVRRLPVRGDMKSRVRLRASTTVVLVDGACADSGTMLRSGSVDVEEAADLAAEGPRGGGGRSCVRMAGGGPEGWWWASPARMAMSMVLLPLLGRGVW